MINFIALHENRYNFKAVETEGIMTSGQNQNAANAALEAAIVHKLTLSGAYVSRARAHYQKIFQFLQTTTSFPEEFKVAQTLVGGSMGKGTSLGGDLTSDFDLVILLRDQLPPLQDFLDFFNVEIEKFGRANFKGYVHGTPSHMSLSFKIGEYKFDVVPGVHYAKNHRKKVIEKIKKSAKPSSKESGGLYSPSLTACTVAFIKEQPEIVRKVIRLAKYWNKCVPIPSDIKIPGRSTIMELVTIYAMQAPFTQFPPLLRGFRRFLEAMERLDTLDIVFFKHYKEIPPQALDATQLPHIFDPVNQYDNVADGLGKDKESMNAFMKKAKETLDRLNDLSRVEKSLERIIGVPYESK